MREDLFTLCEAIGHVLIQKNWLLTTAESCTGGLLAANITEVAGSSAWFERGFVTYSNAAKMDLLGVNADTLANHGAVSEAVAQEMAEGALQNSQAQVAIAVTGVAGPTGGTVDKPVGMVCFAWAVKDQATQRRTQQFSGDRNAVRQQATEYVLSELLTILHH